MEGTIEVREPVKPSSLYVTPTELLVIKGIIEGKTAKEIAQERKVSPQTVQAHRRNVLKRLDCKNMPHLIYLLCKEKILL